MKVKVAVKPRAPKAPNWRLKFLAALDEWLRKEGWGLDFEIVIDEMFPVVVTFAEKEAT